MAALSDEQKKICEDDPFKNHGDDTFLLINKRYDKIIKDPVSESDRTLLQNLPNQTAIMGTFESNNYTFKPVGGGVSGAFLFEIKPKQGTTVRDMAAQLVNPVSQKSRFIKIYIDALTPKKNPVWVKNTRAFREVRALELLSSYWYHNKIKTGITFIGNKNAKIIDFDNVKSLFFRPEAAPLQISNYELSFGPGINSMISQTIENFHKKESQADARTVSILPKYTLLLEMPKAPGFPFFNMEPVDCLFFGTVLQILVVWEHFTEALPKGCHWDLHPNNIFWNKKREMRKSFEIEVEDDLIYEEYEEEAQRELEKKRKKDRMDITNKLKSNRTSFTPEEKKILANLFFSQSKTTTKKNYETMIATIAKGRRSSVKKITITCPEVTIIDFDFVTFDYGEMGIITDEHQKKIDSIGGIGYDLLNWLTMHLPLNAVATLISFLESKKHKFPSHNKVDWCHIICYIAVALCYNFSKIWGKGMDLVMHGMCLSLYKIQNKLKKVRDLRSFLLKVNTVKRKFSHFYTNVGNAATTVRNKIDFDTSFISEGKAFLMGEFTNLIDSSLFSFKNLFYLLKGQIPRIERGIRAGIDFMSPRASNISPEKLTEAARRFYLTISQIPERKHIGNVTFNFKFDFKAKKNYCLFNGDSSIIIDKLLKKAIPEILKLRFKRILLSVKQEQKERSFLLGKIHASLLCNFILGTELCLLKQGKKDLNWNLY